MLLAPDGSLWAWGGTTSELAGIVRGHKATRTTVPVRIGTDTDWHRVTVVDQMVLAVKTNGTLWGWGYSYNGELLAGLGLQDVHPAQLSTDNDWADVYVGHGHVLALKHEGSLWTWGLNLYGQVGDGSRTNVAVPTHLMPGRKWKGVSSGGFSSFGIQADGTLWGWGEGFAPNPVQLDPSTNWTALAGTSLGVLALKSDGTLWASKEAVSIFARGAPVFASDMAQLGKDSDWREVYAGLGSFIARKADGSWWGGGMNDVGQLGLGFTSRETVQPPTRLPLRFEPWAFVTSAGNTTALLGRDGSIWSWGIRAGEVAPPSLFDQVGMKLKEYTSPGAGYAYTPRWTYDTQPHFVWELPPSVKSTLGTNTPSHPKSAP